MFDNKIEPHSTTTPRFGNAKELLRRRNCVESSAPADVYFEGSAIICNAIEKAKIVVAGGYGVGCKENFDLLFRLAEKLEGEVGATRAAVDAGFCEQERMIGLTGLTVHPELYIAVGISGHTLHTAGVKDAKRIVSINRDAAAPINNLADHVIVGDAKEEVTRLLEELSNATITEQIYEQFLQR